MEEITDTPERFVYHYVGKTYLVDKTSDLLVFQYPPKGEHVLVYFLRKRAVPCSVVIDVFSRFPGKVGVRETEFGIVASFFSLLPAVECYKEMRQHHLFPSVNMSQKLTKSQIYQLESKLASHGRTLEPEFVTREKMSNELSYLERQEKLIENTFLPSKDRHETPQDLKPDMFSGPSNQRNKQKKSDSEKSSELINSWVNEGHYTPESYQSSQRNHKNSESSKTSLKVLNSNRSAHSEHRIIKKHELPLDLKKIPLVNEAPYLSPHQRFTRKYSPTPVPVLPTISQPCIFTKPYRKWLSPYVLYKLTTMINDEVEIKKFLRQFKLTKDDEKLEKFETDLLEYEQVDLHEVLVCSEMCSEALAKYLFKIFPFIVRIENHVRVGMMCDTKYIVAFVKSSEEAAFFAEAVKQKRFFTHKINALSIPYIEKYITC